MRKEKDEIIELFHSHLVNTEMTVRDGFWMNWRRRYLWLISIVGE